MENTLSQTYKDFIFFAFKCLFCLGLLLVAAVGDVGCHRAESPEANFSRIREEARHGQLDVALLDVNTAFARYQTKDPEWAARFRILKGHVLFLRGSYNDALVLLGPELPISLTRSDAAVHRKMVQGLAYTYLQNYAQADATLSEAESLASSIGSSFSGDVEQARGILEIDQKHYLQAKVAFQKAFSFGRGRQLPFLELVALGNLGNLAVWERHYDEAIDRFRAALEQAKSLGSLSSESKALGNMGWNYSVVGDFVNAEASFEQGQAKAAQAGLEVDHIRWLNLLAGVYEEEGLYAEADSTGQRALRLAEKQDDKRLHTECLNTMSEIGLATGRIGDAERFNQKAVEIEKAGLDKFGVPYSTIIAGRIATSKKQYYEAKKAFLKITDDKSVETALRWEAQADVAEVDAARGKNGLAEQEFLESIGTITNAWDALEREEFRLSFLSNAIRFYDAYVNFLIEQKRPVDALKVADRSRAQTLEHGLSPKADGKTEVQEAVRPKEIARKWNATLLFYWLGEQQSHLWVITPTKISLLPLPARSEIDARVKSYLDAFPGPRDPLESNNADGKRLYEKLIEPAEKLIPKNSRVIILPDGDLNSLNFETLIVSGDKPHYWIEDVTLLTANSLALLGQASPAAPPADASLFLMGDALQASPDFPALPQAGKEVGLVQGYFAPDKRTVLTKAQAVPSAFLHGKPEESSYLHFATHGTASTLRPLESAVILSAEGDAYKLYARDIVQHPVHAYLVTISACNGAGMKTYAGEGLVGLAWAFLRAGAHNVIGGLWEVSNASTPQLMDELYKGLNAGKDPASALRDAKLTLVHSKGNYKRPFYWGPFQLYAGS